MVQYILEAICFQLVFLIIYDFFLKKETFFQWNRAYLIGTYIMSLVLPWIKLETFRTTLPEKYSLGNQFVWNLDAITLKAVETSQFNISWEYLIFFGGMLLAAIYFGYKLYQIYALRKKGQIRYFPDFTRVVVQNSQVAFSFFKSIFLGDRVLEMDHESIIQHELVHIKQKHSLDLLFFEMMRIAGWFNPLVYVYQNRVSELHEFIADSKVAKTQKKEHYEILLSQVFQTQDISFINQFFKTSLTRLNVLGRIFSFGSQYGQVKKRIVMLQKSKSKKVWQLKYLLLLPVVMGMLFYTSCEEEKKEGFLPTDIEFRQTVDIDEIPLLKVDEAPIFPGCEGSENALDCFREKMIAHISREFKFLQNNMDDESKVGVYVNFIIDQNGNIGKVRKTGANKYLEEEAARVIGLLPQMKPGKVNGKNVKVAINLPISPVVYGSAYNLKVIGGSENGAIISFANIDEVPIFPGCENSEDIRACFNEKIMQHVSKNFRYPEAAQEKGIQGKVYANFIIDEQGNITEIKKRGPDKLLEDEVERIIMRLPKLVAGKHAGKAVRVPFSLPITFKLQ